MKLVTIFAGLLLITSMSCTKEEDHSNQNDKQYDPTILVDTYEKEILLDCAGEAISEKTVRRAAKNSIRIHPVRNFHIDSSSFFNLANSEEYTPHLTFPGPGGDNYKAVTFCQSPKVDGCDLSVLNGDNQIEYKYWSYKYNPCGSEMKSTCTEDILEEHDTRTVHFSHLTENSNKVCRRKPQTCPLTSFPTWDVCQYN